MENFLKKIKSYLKPLIYAARIRLKIDVAYIVKGSFWLNLNQVVSAVFGFILAVVLANLLPENTLGNYRYVLSLGVVVGSFSLTGLNLALIRDVARGIRGLLKEAVRTHLTWGLGTFFASLALGIYYFSKENSEMAWSIIVMGVVSPIFASLHLYAAYWEGRKDYRRLSIYNIFTVATYTVTLIAVISFTHYLPFIIGAYFVTQAACAFFFYRRTVAEDAEKTEHTHHTLNFGKHLSFLHCFSTLAGQLDKILIFHYMGAVQLAVYAISQIPATYILTVFKQVVQLAYPKYSEKTIQEIRSTIYYQMTLVTIPLVLIVLLYILVAPFLFHVFFPKYTDAILYSQISVLSLLFFQKKLITYAILAHANNKKIYSMSITSSIARIILLLMLLPSYGIWGAIFTEIILQGMGFVSSLVMLRKV